MLSKILKSISTWWDGVLDSATPNFYTQLIESIKTRSKEPLTTPELEPLACGEYIRFDSDIGPIYGTNGISDYSILHIEVIFAEQSGDDNLNGVFIKLPRYIEEGIRCKLVSIPQPELFYIDFPMEAIAIAKVITHHLTVAEIITMNYVLPIEDFIHEPSI